MGNDMAHFAELDENNIVKRVIVVGNSDTADAYGVEKEYIGAAFCERLLGGRWVQTSYNHNFRKRYAGIGMVYREDLDAFIYQQPHPSWIFNNETYDWEPPVPYPDDDKVYLWDEATTSWVERQVA
jgi:hypothetical protein